MKITIISLFPRYFISPLQESIMKRAQEGGHVSIDLVDIRDFAHDKHHKVDDRPFGGGPGMVLKAEPTVAAIRSVKTDESIVCYLSPQGVPLKSTHCHRLAELKHLILLCGHYEGIDQRIIDLEVDAEISIGDYVLTSGMPAALVVIDAVIRWIPGVLGHEDSARLDSFENGGFDYPHYTQPRVYQECEVPPILLSGDHAKIAKWRQSEATRKTERVRPDLLVD